MKIKEGFTMRSLAGQHVVIGEGLAQVNFNKMITLNDTAAFLFSSVQSKDFTVEDLTKLLFERYDVDLVVAAADADKIAKKWIECGIATE